MSKSTSEIYFGELTEVADTKPIKLYVKSPRGTLYWGGAGLDGDYTAPTLKAFQNAGISNVSVGLTNSASKEFSQGLKFFGTLIDAARAGLSIRYEDVDEWTITSGMSSSGPQFNLIGYSYGSLLAAQTANCYAKKGIVIDHLVLIGSPIDTAFLGKLKSNKNIKKVVIQNLTTYGDEIYAGMTQAELVNPHFLKKLGDDMLANKGQGHFYYGHLVAELPARLASLANWLVQQGLR